MIERICHGNNYLELPPLGRVGCMNALVQEHYIWHLHDTYIGVDASDELIQFKKEHPGIKIILYNLEHKYPQTSPGVLPNCSQGWLGYFKMVMEYVDEVWDFNIENYIYFRDIGHGAKFKFVPLRYTTYFERFDIYREPCYDLEFEAIFDTTIRMRLINTLSMPVNIDGQDRRVNYKICNTDDCRIKYREKVDARWGFDFPHYDFPETINCFRIFEYICLNRQPIVYDPYKITSKEYFGDLPIYIDELTVPVLYDVIHGTPRADVAERFRRMTYTPDAYEQYRRCIVNDFINTMGIQVPDTVLAPLF